MVEHQGAIPYLAILYHGARAFLRTHTCWLLAAPRGCGARPASRVVVVEGLCEQLRGRRRREELWDVQGAWALVELHYITLGGVERSTTVRRRGGSLLLRSLFYPCTPPPYPFTPSLAHSHP